MQCRHCSAALEHTFVDLGFAPPSNAYLSAESLSEPERWYPLRVRVCDSCWLVQTEDYAGAEDLFDAEYAYFSSVSKSWLDHAAAYCRMIIERLSLDENSRVVEVASNDGYLLRNFQAMGIPCLGIEPTHSTARAARELGIDVREAFFGEAFARELASAEGGADLVIGNNVYAHVPDINDFTRGLAAVLAPGGSVTLEFPHLLNLVQGMQFDTIYHEHFSYLSLGAVRRVFGAAGLRVFDVEELPTHGGSLRIYGCRDDDARDTSAAVATLLERETGAGLERLDTYREFQSRVDAIKDDLLLYLIEQKRAGRKVVAYGAAAKGNTLLNYAGVKADLLPCVLDAAPSKQGRFMPGSHIPILAPDRLQELAPDEILVMPWNIAAEVRDQLGGKVPEHCRFVTAIPGIGEVV